MAGLIASIICAIFIFALFRLDREPEVRVSKALWIPTMWLFLAASRNVSEWFHYSSGASDRYLEGNPLDRAVLSAILALGVIVLFSRGRRVWVLLQSNIPILLYFLYCGISILWSDFPDVSFKRWFRGMGDVVMVLIVLSDPDWLAALRRLLARLGFVLLPLSVVFIRYYPALGRTYSKSGAPMWTGVASDKNALGMLCLVFGLAAVYRFLEVYQGEGGGWKNRTLIAQGVLITMALYLLFEANSATASACFFLAGGVMVLTQLSRLARRPAMLHLLVATALIVPLSAMFLGVGSGLVENLGRNSTFTGRTAIWHSALGMVTNPIFGTGYESFWLGPRLKEMSRLIDQGVNQAHNGYIEVYLNLGWLGLALVALLLVSGYRRIFTAVRWQAQAGNLRLAYFIVAVAYNFSEGGFKMMHPVWIVFLLAIAVPPKIPNSETPNLGIQLADGHTADESRSSVPVSVRVNRDRELPRFVRKTYSRE
jgi:exopolysaccharide production protein ExoQ